MCKSSILNFCFTLSKLFGKNHHCQTHMVYCHLTYHSCASRVAVKGSVRSEALCVICSAPTNTSTPLRIAFVNLSSIFPCFSLKSLRLHLAPVFQWTCQSSWPPSPHGGGTSLYNKSVSQKWSSSLLESVAMISPHCKTSFGQWLFSSFIRSCSHHLPFACLCRVEIRHKMIAMCHNLHDQWRHQETSSNFLIINRIHHPSLPLHALLVVVIN